MVGQIYPTELQLKASYFDTEAPFLDLNLSIKDSIVYLKFINAMILILKLQ